MENEILTMLEINGETGEQIERNFTEAELEQRKADQAKQKAEITKAKALMKARESALAKLAALGLTEEEVASL